MAARRQPPRGEPPAVAGPDERTELALAWSRHLREQGNRQMQAAREYVAAMRRRDPGVRSSPSGHHLAARLIDAGTQAERFRQARASLAALAARLVQTEEAAARLHDKLAGQDSPHAAQYRQAAEDARQAARRAREIQRQAAGPDPRG